MRTAQKNLLDKAKKLQESFTDVETCVSDAKKDWETKLAEMEKFADQHNLPTDPEEKGFEEMVILKIFVQLVLVLILIYD